MARSTLVFPDKVLHSSSGKETRDLEGAVRSAVVSMSGDKRAVNLAGCWGGLSLDRASGKSECGPLIVPSERQTRVRQQLVCGQIAWLAPVEDRLGDVRGEIAEADEPREIGRADAFPLGQCCKGHAVATYEHGIKSRFRCHCRRARRTPSPNRNGPHRAGPTEGPSA